MSKGKSKKPIIIISIILVVLIGLGALTYFFLWPKVIAPMFGADKKADPIGTIVYLEDGELYCYNNKLSEGTKIAELDDGFTDIYNNDFQTSESGERLFFASSSREMEPGKIMQTPMGEMQMSPTYLGYTLSYVNPTKADSEIEEVAENVTSYVISADGEYVLYSDPDGWYWHKIGGKTIELDEFTGGYALSKDGKTLCYQDETSLYKVSFGKDAEKIVDEINGVQYISEDLNTIIYDEGNATYKLIDGEKPVLIDEDITQFLNVSNKGEVHYLTEDRSNLYYFDGESSKKLADNIVFYTEDIGGTTEGMSRETPFVVFTEYGKLDLKIAIRGEVFDLKGGPVANGYGSLSYSDETGILYYVYYQDAKGILCKVDISSGEPKDIERVDDDVRCIDAVMEDGTLIYSKNLDDNKLALMVGNKTIHKGLGRCLFTYGDNVVFSEYNDSDGLYSLYIYDGDEVQIITDELASSSSCDTFSDGLTVYFNNDKELCAYSNGETVKLSDEIEKADIRFTDCDNIYDYRNNLSTWNKICVSSKTFRSFPGYIY